VEVKKEEKKVEKKEEKIVEVPSIAKKQTPKN
jgi:hypothetical protein